MLETLTIDDFTPLEGQDFEAEAEGYVDTFTLIQVCAAKRPGMPGGRAPFSLLFRGTRTDLRYESNVELRHPALGSLELGLVPVARLADGRHEYQIGFN